MLHLFEQAFASSSYIMSLLKVQQAIVFSCWSYNNAELDEVQRPFLQFVSLLPFSYIIFLLLQILLNVCSLKCPSASQMKPF